MNVNFAILVSGKGLNTENIIRYFHDYLDAEVSCIITNENDSNLFNKIRRYKIDKYVTTIYKEIDKILIDKNINYIILDDWYEKIPPNFCKKYKYKIINLSTTIKENEYVISNTDQIEKTKSGSLNIHFVDDVETHTIFEKIYDIEKYDTTEMIEMKSRNIEDKYFPIVIENLIRSIHKI